MDNDISVQINQTSPLINEKELSKDPFEKLGQLILLGLQGKLMACKLYVELINKKPESKEIIHEKYPFISESDWSKMESVGRGALIPQLLGGGHNANSLSGCPVSEQEKYNEKPIDVLIKNNGQYDTIKIYYYNLSTFQRKQVFAKSHVRTVAEQKAYLLSGEAEKAIVHAENGKPYHAIKGFLIIKTPCKIPYRDITYLLNEMQ
jgi:hypothetical protein